MIAKRWALGLSISVLVGCSSTPKPDAGCGDTTADPDNCGACGHACPPGQSCVASACTVVCPPLTPNLCGSGANALCTNFQTDARNCGGCAGDGGVACPSGQLCNGAAQCAESCAAGYSTCGSGASAYCANLSDDALNCHACGAACPLGQACVAGACGCPASTPNACGTGAAAFCTNFLADEANCGGCAGDGGVACPSGEVCDGTGKCAASCLSGEALCSGLCTNPRTDPLNCGGCAGDGGVACPSGEVCDGPGKCAASCLSGEALCSGLCTNPQTDPLNCGACAGDGGVACASGQVCNGAGQCTESCAAGYSTCGSGAAAFCADLLTDANNCHACGASCPLGQACVAGACTCPASTPNACGSGASAFCTDLETDSSNCGSCGDACPSNESCNGSGACWLPGGATITGTVSYSGALAGRIYVDVLYEGCGGCSPIAGTSLAAPGPYTIHIGPVQGSYEVQAFVDVVGNQVLYPSADPTGTTAGFYLQGTGRSGADVALSDPDAGVAPSPPGQPGAILGTDVALLLWPPSAASVDHDNVYYGAFPPGPCPAAKGAYANVKTVPDSKNGGGPQAALAGLTPGNYCFLVTAIDNGVEGTPSLPGGPFTLPPATVPGTHTVSGQASFAGVAATGPLFVALATPGSGGAASVTDVVSPTSPQSFTVSNVPNGTYEVYALIDMPNTPYLGPGVLINATNAPPVVTVDGGNVSSVNVTIPTSDVVASAGTSLFSSVGGSSDYSLSLNVQSNLKDPVLVSLVSGPNLFSRLDLGLDDQNGGLLASFRGSAGLPTVPSAGDAYVFSIAYSDGGSENVTAAVATVLPLATLVTPPPGGAAASDKPTFTWTLPGGLSPSDEQELRVQQVNGPTVWSPSQTLVTGATTVVYNSDGTANPPTLVSGMQYQWSIQIFDGNDDSAQIQATFTAP